MIYPQNLFKFYQRPPNKTDWTPPPPQTKKNRQTKQNQTIPPEKKKIKGEKVKMQWWREQDISNNDNLVILDSCSNNYEILGERYQDIKR